MLRQAYLNTRGRIIINKILIYDSSCPQYLSTKANHAFNPSSTCLINDAPHHNFYYTKKLLSHPVFVKHFGSISFPRSSNFNHSIRLFSTQKDNTSLQKSDNKEDEGSLKVDRSLKILKDELIAGQKEAERIEAANKSELEQKKKPIKEKVWNELVHYYHGFRLFFIDLKVSTRLFWRVIRGHVLSRQEKLQLVRSAADLFRLVPFLVFIIVPFMEFLLPVYLKLFPGALPSTFQEQSRELDKHRKQLKLKMEMAKFLQETVEELALERKKKGAADSKVADFSTFLKNIREGGGYVSNVQLLKYSKLFEDELTLDNLSEAQLRALCRIVGITPILPANILRFQLSMKLDELKRDDRLISKEGVENLSVADLQAACRARGMRAIGVSEERLRQQLNQWLELSFDEKVPPSLLLLSSTLYLPEEVTFGDRLKTLISTLPPEVADEVKLKIVESEGASSLDNKNKFELVRSIEDILKREKEAKRRLKEQRKLAQAAGEQKVEQIEEKSTGGEKGAAMSEKTSTKSNKNGEKTTLKSPLDKELKPGDKEALKGLQNEHLKSSQSAVGDPPKENSENAAMIARKKKDMNS